MPRAKTNVVPFPQRVTQPIPDGTIIARMKRDILAAVHDSENSHGELELLKIASPEDCLHCHRLAHRALRQLVKDGLIVRAGS